MRLLPMIILACHFAALAGEVIQRDDAIELKDEQLLFHRVSPKKYGAAGADFFIQETEVTNRMFAAYLKARKLEKCDLTISKQYEETQEKLRGTRVWVSSDAVVRVINPTLLWNGVEPPADMADFPVSMVTVNEAAEFCEWLTERYPQLGTFRLPKESEWLIAAYGKERKFPWGDD